MKPLIGIVRSWRSNGFRRVCATSFQHRPNQSWAALQPDAPPVIDNAQFESAVPTSSLPAPAAPSAQPASDAPPAPPPKSRRTAASLRFDARDSARRKALWEGVGISPDDGRAKAAVGKLFTAVAAAEAFSLNQTWIKIDPDARAALCAAALRPASGIVPRYPFSIDDCRYMFMKVAPRPPAAAAATR